MFSGFMTNAWIIASIVAVVAGVVGFFVVLRGNAFEAHALPLGSFPGAAAATLLGIDSVIGLAVFAALGVLGINRLGRRGKQSVGTALSLVFLLGLGALFFSFTGAYAPAIYSFLFGEVLGTSSSQILPLAVLGALAIAAIAILYRPLLLDSLSPELVEASGVRSSRMEILFLLVLALATVMSLPVVGALLVFSLMVGPPAAARSFTNRPLIAVLLAVSFALLTVWIALALSYLSDWPVGFFVGSLGAVSYGLGRGWSSWRSSRKSTSRIHEPSPNP
ncbi:MAG: metal ABC transporter permease [Actinomycetota bacterium]|nr:MAG: metal ABC transporter permease [Actinomycetota bacterium]